MSAIPPLPRRPSQPPSKAAILHSAFIFPGAGQYLQKRRGPALLYAVTGGFATALFLFMFARYFHTITQGLVDKIMGTYVPDPNAPPLRSLLMPGVYLLIVYLASLYDTAFAWYKEWLRWKQQQ